MSLVNDALKRAKQLQPPALTAPAAGPELRPAEPTKEPRELGLFLPLILGMLAVLLFLIGGLMLARNYSARARQAQPEPSSSQLRVAAVKPASAPARTAPAEAEPALAAHRRNATASPTTNTGTQVAAVSNAPSPDSIVTPPPSVEPPRPKPAPLKLQAIIFNPRRPSAVISGKTMFLGDRIGEWRLMAIGANTAKLTGPAGTNVLSLD